MIEVHLIDYMGTDLTTVNAARVSFNKESTWDNDYEDEVLQTKDEKLVHYLAEHKHTSPFGHAFASFRVKAPVFVARQLFKHKFLRPNEVSRRYVDTSPTVFFPEGWRAKHENKKQGSGDVRTDSDHWNAMYAVLMNGCLNLYDKMIEAGVCPEQARMVLPQSMYTEWYWSGSLDAFADMYNLRIKPDAQLETQEVARQIGDIMSVLYPVSWEALTRGPS